MLLDLANGIKGWNSPRASQTVKGGGGKRVLDLGGKISDISSKYQSKTETEVTKE